MDHKIKEIVRLCALLTLVVTSGLAIVSVGSSPTTTFAVDPTNATARVGESVTVNVRIYEAFFLYSWQVYISWDDTVLELVLARCVYAGFLADQPEGSSENTRFDHPDWAIFSEATVGSYTGKSAVEGLLVSVTFLVKAESTSTIAIDHATQTLYVECFIPPQLNKVTNFNKENGNFVAPWPEDISADGWIDVFDISMVCIDWGTSVPPFPPVQKNATADSGGWTSGSNAYTSDDSYATSSTDGLEHTYMVYDYETASWIGVEKVEVGLELHSDGNDNLDIAVSNNGGSSFSGTTENVETDGITADTLLWYDFTGAYSWTPSGVEDIAVKITHAKSGGQAETIYVDWLPVRVTPILPESSSPYTDLNGDGVVDITDLSMVALEFGEHYAG